MVMFNTLVFRLLITALGLFLGATLPAMGFDDHEFIAVKEVQERHTETLLALDGVVGTAVGLNEQNHLAIHVYVTHPGVVNIPAMLDDKPVHVIVTGQIRALKTAVYAPVHKKHKLKGPVTSDPKVRFARPVPTGVSTGHPNITAGTIACRVTDGVNVYALSNNHVFANENRAAIGDVVLQPGVFDGGNKLTDVIGELTDFVEISFDATANNVMDAAIAITRVDLLGNATFSTGYGMPKKQTIAPALGMQVKKCGRTTGCTNGSIQGLNATVSVGYDAGVARFVNQIIISGQGNFSAPGDSGSLIVMDSTNPLDDKRPVGLLFAGSDTVTVANPIDAVLSAFGVTIDGQ
jgi:hypothetical protein